MKKTFMINVKIKGCNKVFRKGLAPGVVAQQEATFDAPEDHYKSDMFAAHLIELEHDLREEAIETYIEEIK